MNVSEVIENRVSCRGFKKEPVAQSLLEEIFTKAQNSPSNCNVQPWQAGVVAGKTKDILKEKFIATLFIFVLEVVLLYFDSDS